MKSLVIAALFSAVAFADESATVTVYREKPGGFLRDQANGFKMFSGKPNQASPSRMHWTVYVDGRKAANVRGNEFVTYRLPAGRHELRAGNSERIVLELKPGAASFVHLGSSIGIVDILPHQSVTEVTCAEAAAHLAGNDPSPVAEKHLYWGEVGASSFPACH